MKKFKEWLSIQLVKNPGRIILCTILFFNVAFFLLSAGIISALSVNLNGTEGLNFLEASYYTITMILDAGCISEVITSIGEAGFALTIVCLAVVLIGMISFTGAVIGYVTNYISSFIEHSNAGKRKLHLSNHFVLLNWNSRASEIVNDMLYCDEKLKVVILVPDHKEEIEKEIEERLSDTINQENKSIEKQFKNLPFLARIFAIKKHKFKRKITVIIREGDVFSSKQLADISLEKARAVIILENDVTRSVCKFEYNERIEELSKGNPQTVKTLMQVADITAAESSFDNQRIIVEITDEWTGDLVNKIIKAKENKGKCNIVPVVVNQVLGQILSQFCLMPELNDAYSELFSSKGVEFYTKAQEFEDEKQFIEKHFKNHNHSIPITVMKKDGKNHAYFVAENDKDVDKKTNVQKSDYKVDLNKDYWIERKNVIILGHNSMCKNIMAGFSSFSSEWKRGDQEIVRIVIIDDKKNLEKMNYYKDYPFVLKTVEADVYDREKICYEMESFISSNKEDTSVLILSDDTVNSSDADAGALANLVYVRDIINKKLEENPNFDVESVDVIVELINPKHHDIVNSYNINNVVISNRYVSKMVTQISEVEEIFDFYSDILTYDEGSTNEYSSKELYVKKVTRYFNSIPAPTTADKFIRAVYYDSINPEKFTTPNPTIVLGYVKPGGKTVLFGGDLSQIKVELKAGDKLILFSAH